MAYVVNFVVTSYATVVYLRCIFILLFEVANNDCNEVLGGEVTLCE